MIQKTVNLNSKNEVRVKVVEYEGRSRLDIRHYFNQDPAKPNDFIPTRKGINISIELGQELMKALSSVLAEFSNRFDAEGERQSY